MGNQRSLVAFVLFVSFLGLAISMAIALIDSGEGVDSREREYFIGGLFGTLCVLGMVAVLRPGPCSRLIGSRRSTDLGDRSMDSPTESPIIRGHHPDCSSFSSHVLNLDGKILCVGCIGLFTGALISLVGTVITFFGGLKIPGGNPIALYIGGFFVAIGLIHFAYGTGSRELRFTVNAMFPIGAFLIIASVDQRLQNTGASLFVLLIILFWIFTRVILSRWDHSRICGSCEKPCVPAGS